MNPPWYSVTKTLVRFPCAGPTVICLKLGWLGVVMAESRIRSVPRRRYERISSRFWLLIVTTKTRSAVASMSVEEPSARCRADERQLAAGAYLVRPDLILGRRGAPHGDEEPPAARVESQRPGRAAERNGMREECGLPSRSINRRPQIVGEVVADDDQPEVPRESRGTGARACEGRPESMKVVGTAEHPPTCGSRPAPRSRSGGSTCGEEFLRRHRPGN